MAKKDERFIKVLNEGQYLTTNREIWVTDKRPASTILDRLGYAGGLTRCSTPTAHPCRDPDPIRRGMTPLLLRS